MPAARSPRSPRASIRADAQDRRRDRPLRHAGADRHPRPRLHRHRTSAARYDGDNSVYPDGLHLPRPASPRWSMRAAPGWRNFADFKDRVIDRSRTRVLAFLNIVGHGMRGRDSSSRTSPTWRPKPTADNGAQANKDLDRRHQDRALLGAEWAPVERAVEAGTTREHTRDGGLRRLTGPSGRSQDLVHEEAPPGRHLHALYSGLRAELDDAGQGATRVMLEGRKRGVIFDVGHGGGSFLWRVAVPAIEARLRCRIRSRPTCTSAA